MWVVGQGRESLSESGREGRCEELHGLNERAHVLGGLGESILESGDGGEDLRKGDENVDTSDGPDVDGRLVVGVLGVVVSRGPVDVVLEDSGPDHSKRSEDKASGDFLEGSESDAALAEERIDENIQDC